MSEENNKKVVTRFAPSPTGLPHLGTVMYALLNYIYARQNEGMVIMRSEDTDPVRSKLEYEKAIIDGLAWLGIKADDFYRQTDRLEIYKKYIAKMIADKTAYISTDTNEKGETRDVVRFKNPNKVITFHDSSRGDISVDTTELEDFIIARDVNSPLYHLTVVVDDHETGVTHVIRGEDGLANTPRQILIQEAIGAKRPVYAHFPFIMLPNRTKMGKRNGAKSVQEYTTLGYLPEAIINFVILMAWHPKKDDKELFTIPELIQDFQLERIGKSGAILDEKKLDWLNKEHMKLMPIETRNAEILKWLKNNPTIGGNEKLNDGKFMLKLFPIIFDHISKWSDINTMVEEGELDYFFNKSAETSKLLLVVNPENENIIKTHLEWLKNTLDSTPEEIFNSVDKVKSLIFDYATENSRKDVLWPLRVALSGKVKSPDPFTLIYILGKKESIERIQNALNKLS